MKRAFTLIFALMVWGGLWAQHEPIQPYEELGIKVKVLTLSNGKYQESFPNDTLQRIGSVMFNRVTGEVVSVVERDTLYGEYDLRPEVSSRWISPDPMARAFPGFSPYNYAGNNPIMNIDVAGLFQYPAHLAQQYAEKYPMFTKYMQENLKNDVMASETIMVALLHYSNGGLTRESIASDLTFGSGPTVIIDNIDVTIDGATMTVDGKYREENGVHNLYINEEIIAAFEKAAGNPKALGQAKEALLLGGVSTLLHEYVHYGDRNNDYGGEGAGGIEEGHAFEAAVYTTGIENRPAAGKIDIRTTMSILNLLKTGKYNPNDKTEQAQPDKINPSVIPTLPKQ